MEALENLPKTDNDLAHRNSEGEKLGVDEEPCSITEALWCPGLATKPLLFQFPTPRLY